MLLLERTLEQLREVCSEVLISGHERGGIAPSAIWVQDHRDAAGPLAGIEAALEHAPRHPLLSLPCDLPNITADTLRLLLSARRPSSHATAFRHADGRVEPLVAIWEPGALGPLVRFLDSGRRAAHVFLSECDVCWVEIPSDLADHFSNLNTPEDLARWRRSASTGDPCAR